MGFIGKDDTGDPTNYNFTSTTAMTDTYTYANDVSVGGSAVTIPTLFYCGHCPRRFDEEQDYEFHIMWHMLDDIIMTLKPKQKPWWGELKDIEGNANLTT